MNYISCEGFVRGGKPVIRGTRVTVSEFLSALTEVSIQEFSDDLGIPMASLESVLLELSHIMENLKERTAKSQLTDAGLDIYSSIESSIDDTVIERLSDNTLIQLIEHYKFLSSSEARNICLMAKELLHLRKLR